MGEIYLTYAQIVEVSMFSPGKAESSFLSEKAKTHPKSLFPHGKFPRMAFSLMELLGKNLVVSWCEGGGTIGLYHPLDGITNPKYKLLCSLTTKFFCKEKKALAFN